MDETLQTTRGPVSLRCEQPGDAGFLYTLFRSHALPGLVALPCNEDALEALVRMQFEAQTAGYRSQFPDARFAILHHGDAPVGRLIIDKTDGAACIVDFALLPAVQGGGLGTAILRGVLAGLAESGMIVRCKVMFTNIPSLRMCQRAGFVHDDGEPPFLQLEWHPPGTTARV